MDHCEIDRFRKNNIPDRKLWWRPIQVKRYETKGDFRPKPKVLGSHKGQNKGHDKWKCTHMTQQNHDKDHGHRQSGWFWRRRLRCRWTDADLTQILRQRPIAYGCSLLIEQNIGIKTRHSLHLKHFCRVFLVVTHSWIWRKWF